ncbi:MAG: ABC transporter ATP-binding protein [archaeon]|nr:ABC transporter ATP-binding protein [archaeon]
MKLKIEKLNLIYSDWEMKNLSLEIQGGSFTAIVGPSGCGKTTLLRTIAGLETPVSGNIFFNKNNVTNIPPEERNVGFVFQGDSLFSHLNVFDNVAFGIKMKKQSDVQKKVKETLKLVHLEGFEKRKVNHLSGGEKKRVAIARAIAFRPELLLLDEPLNGLDAPLKEKMKFFLKELQKKTGLTMIFVSHDIDEAFFLSDKIVVMNFGKIEQSGLPVEIFSKPKNSFVKNFVSDYVLIEAKKKGKNLEARLKIPYNGKGKAFVNLKKTNYKFVE